jgi:hypothetical protein
MRGIPAHPGAWRQHARNRLANFSRYREPNQVDVQARLERSITLKVAGIEESISVEGGSDVDAQRTGLSSRFDLQSWRRIPVAGFQLFDFTKRTRRVADVAVERHGRERVGVRLGRQ